MKPLTLNLDDSIAARFNNLSPKEKGSVEKLIATVLEELFKKNQRDKLFQLMDKSAEEASAKGLTIAKLATIMGWDDQTTINLFGEEAVRDGR